MTGLFPKGTHGLKEDRDTTTSKKIPQTVSFHERVTHRGEEAGILTSVRHSSLIVHAHIFPQIGPSADPNKRH